MPILLLQLALHLTPAYTIVVGRSTLMPCSSLPRRHHLLEAAACRSALSPRRVAIRGTRHDDFVSRILDNVLVVLSVCGVGRGGTVGVAGVSVGGMFSVGGVVALVQGGVGNFGAVGNFGGVVGGGIDGGGDGAGIRRMSVEGGGG